MKTSEVSDYLVGKKVEFNFTGLRSTGVVTEIVENKYSKGVKIKFDKPIVWGDCSYEENEFTARKWDDFGCLSHVQIIWEFEIMNKHSKILGTLTLIDSTLPSHNNICSEAMKRFPNEPGLSYRLKR